MGDPLINYKIGHEKQLFFLNKERVIGIQNVQISENLGLQPINYAGIGSKTVYFSPREEQSATLSLNSLLINKDYFLPFVTGLDLANAYILRHQTDLDNNYCLISGYFTDYESTYSIGNPASISTTFIAINNAGKIPTGEMNSVEISDLNYIKTGNFDITTLKIPSHGSISLGIDEFNTNRVNAYSIRINVNKVPVYKMGSKFPKKVEVLYPINVECIFNFEVGDYQNIKLRQFPQNNVVKNLNLVVKDHNTNEQICSYSFQDLNLINETYEVSVNNSVSATVTYRG